MILAVEEKIRQLDKEIVEIKQKMSRLKNGPAKDNLKRKALTLLKKKKMYEGQRDQLMNQQFNMDNISFAQESMKDTVTTVAAMKQASTTLKQQFKEIDIDDIEDLQDDMQEMMDQNAEIQEALSRTYETPDGIADEDLEAELDELGDELDNEEEVPTYLKEAPQVPTNDVKQSAQQELTL